MAEETAKNEDTQKEALPNDNPSMDTASETRTKAKTVVLKGKIEILSDQPLPHYDQGNVKAYKAVDLKDSEKNLFALICEREVMPRVKAANVYGNIVNPQVINLVDAGVVLWEPDKAERIVFIYKDNLGKKLLPDDAPAALGWKQDRVMNTVIRPFITILQDFRDKDFIHGSIRPSNMFDGGDSGDSMKVMLGDCLTSPCSYNQSPLYETIPRAMADPIGRGVGTKEDDLYAFGVCIAVMMRATDPMIDLSEEHIIRKKIELGSYAAITGKDRFKGTILELLRGLLNDDPTARWTIDEVTSWIEGTRVNPKQTLKRNKAPRPFTFNQEKYFFLPFLAMDVCANPEETRRVVEDGDLKQWIERSLEDDNTSDALDRAIANTLKGGKTGDYTNRLASHVSMALDPMAPVRYTDKAFRVDTFGKYIAQAIRNDEDLTPYADLINRYVLMNWVGNYDNPNFDRASWVGRLDTCRNYLRQSKIGYGIERCLYTLDPTAPCLSPKLKNFLVRTPEELVLAFEKISEKDQQGGLFLDRHATAFLAARDQRSVENSLFDLAREKLHKKILANLLCFAVIQKRATLGPLPNLAKAFMNAMPSVLGNIHDRELRDLMEKELKRHMNDGNLSKMAEIAANIAVFNRDFKAFKRAMMDYAKVEHELKNLNARLEDKANFGRKVSGEVAAFISAVLAGILTVAMSFMMLEGQSLF